MVERARERLFVIWVNSSVHAVVTPRFITTNSSESHNNSQNIKETSIPNARRSFSTERNLNKVDWRNQCGDYTNVIFGGYVLSCCCSTPWQHNQLIREPQQLSKHQRDKYSECKKKFLNRKKPEQSWLKKPMWRLHQRDIWWICVVLLLFHTMTTQPTHQRATTTLKTSKRQVFRMQEEVSQ